MNFQRSCAVEADGIVGEQTLIQLTKAEREPVSPAPNAKSPLIGRKPHVIYPGRPETRGTGAKAGKGT
jgi:hypothetical protein